MSTSQITLFDIPTSLGAPTSPNTWKVRLVLNYKGLQYTTRWVPTSEIEAVCTSLSIPPTGTKPSGEPHYTLPALIDYSTQPPVILSDSTPIIEYLDHTYSFPTRQVFPSSSRSLHLLFQHFLNTNLMTPIFPLMIMSICQSKVPSDQVHFRQRMEEAYGKPLEQIEPQGEERRRAWSMIEEAFRVLAKSLRGDVYFQNGTPSYADFALCAFLIWLKKVSPDEAWPKICSWNGGRWARLLDLCREWTHLDPLVDTEYTRL